MIFKKRALAQQPVLRNSYTDFHENLRKVFIPLIRNKDANITSRSPHTTFIINRFTALYQQNAQTCSLDHHHHHLPPWIRSFDLFRHRRIAIVSWGVHGLFFLEVCSWGRLSGVCYCPFFQGGWSSFVCIWVSRLVFQRSLVLSLWLRFLFYPVLCCSLDLMFTGPCIIVIVEE